jgi:hypothetical protein
VQKEELSPKRMKESMASCCLTCCFTSENFKQLALDEFSLPVPN